MNTISPFYQNSDKCITIYILKTNIADKTSINTIKLLLNSNPNIIKWSLDLEDIDKVLKVESTNKMSEEELIEQIKSRGIFCEVLD